MSFLSIAPNDSHASAERRAGARGALVAWPTWPTWDLGGTWVRAGDRTPVVVLQPFHTRNVVHSTVLHPKESSFSSVS